MNNWSKIRTFLDKIQDFGYLSIGNILGAAILSLFWIFLASLLGPESYGEISYLIAIANTVSVIAFLGAGQTIIVYVAKGIRIENITYSITLISSIITSVVIFLILEKIEISLYVIGYVIFGLISHELLGLKLFKKYSKILISQRILTVSLALILYFLLGLDGIILGYAIAFFPSVIFLYKGFKETNRDFGLLRPRLGFMMNNYGKDLAYGAMISGLGFGNSSTTLGHALSYVFSNEGISHGHELAFTTTISHKFNNSEYYQRFMNLVKKLKFSNKQLKENLNDAAELILMDKKHLDYNPKPVTKKYIIDLLETIQNKII